MKPGLFIFHACVLAFGLSGPAYAQQSRDSHGKAPVANAGPSEPLAPIIITRPHGQVSVDPGNTDAIQDTIGRDPNPGAGQEIHCPGGQTIRQAEGDVRDVTCK